MEFEPLKFNWDHLVHTKRTTLMDLETQKQSTNEYFDSDESKSMMLSELK